MNSMTGYALKSSEFKDYTVYVEIKSLNNRFLELKFKIPPYMENLESRLRKRLKASVKRGKVEVCIKVEAKGHLESKFIKSMIERYYGLIKDIEGKTDFRFQVSLSEILSLKSLINPYEEIAYMHIPAKTVEEIFDDALKDFQDSRYIEGENTKKDLLKYMQMITNSLKRIENVYPSVIVKYKNQLKEKIYELMDGKVDEARLMMEVGIFASKVDISEEISRINGHIGKMLNIIKSNRVCGRELDFIIQEINREINTIGSKVPDYAVSEEVVNTKTSLDKIKEQVRNIE